MNLTIELSRACNMYNPSSKPTEGSDTLTFDVGAIWLAQKQSWITRRENTGGTYYALSPLSLYHTLQQPVFYVVFLHDLSEEPNFPLLNF